ncbi:hypothetical protein I5M27_15525 [Adhaeribacter sp. BT258]|uniref:Uncharacterized protein n=1 Tax=Adhaeribacter terrigena TaxID=2793070 RepID=A0ABS1C514_9BACT|nr:hypothetical protein [Adhaeribacter terrigena]MBK0404408.1 hypothetical protein [Adhaeribacter terrigena]
MFEPRNPRNQPESTYTKFVKYFSLVMTLVYPAIGVFLFFSRPDQVRLDDTTKKILGAVLVIYGIIRMVRVYQEHFKTRNRNHREE